MAALTPESRTRRVRHGGLKAVDDTPRSVARLSQRLRRFLGDRASTSLVEGPG